MTRAIGTVTRIIRGESARRDKGSGYFFIEDADGEQRFAHANDIGQQVYDTLKEGTKVEFTPVDPQPGAKRVRGNGFRAEQVTVVK